MKVLFTALAVLISTAVFSQSILGKWKTIDDETGKAKSVVEIYKDGDKYYGKIVELFRTPEQEQNPICDKCDEDDSRYKKPVRGMIIITDMEYDDDDKELDDGEIMDPAKGESYDCKIWLGEDGKLNVRGYVGFFYRTQLWEPYTG
jgi:uncharacterized protein (DUF2147 family)